MSYRPTQIWLPFLFNSNSFGDAEFATSQESVERIDSGINEFEAGSFSETTTMSGTASYQIGGVTGSEITEAINFLEKELILRKKNNLPPFEKFISIIISGKSEKKIEEFAYELKNKLKNNLNSKILGPVIAPINKIKNNYRYRILIRSKKTQNVQKRLSDILINLKNHKEIKLAVDVDPISFN